MLSAMRIFIGLAAGAASAGIACAATVNTERLTAPRSLELPPNLTVPRNGPHVDGGRAEDDGSAAKEDEPPLPEVHYGEEGLPPAVRQMRRDILEAAENADFRRLRLIYEANDPPPTLSFGEIGDPIEFLKQSSGDGEGLEVLAIMIEVLQAGWVHKNPGTPEEMYVWPYFTEIPLERLTDPQKVELYEIVTASDFEEMKTFGSYIFYRLGIGPDGTWYYFVAGD